MLRFFGLFLAILFRYFGLAFGVTTSVKASDNGVLYGGRQRRWRIFIIETAWKRAQPTLPPKIALQLGENDITRELITVFFSLEIIVSPKEKVPKRSRQQKRLYGFGKHAKAQTDLSMAIDGRPNTMLMPGLDCSPNRHV